MYEYRDFEWCMDKLLSNVPTNVSKAEGSLIYTALAPVAQELERLYIDLDEILENTFADTASYEFLQRRAAERGLTPKPAANCIARGVFNCEIPTGSRFFRGAFVYISGEKLTGLTEYEYALTCTTAGSAPNGTMGELSDMDGVEGFESGEITAIITPGVDMEDVEDFRARYYATFRSIAFGGNVADYIEKTKPMSGVGALHVYPTWDGGGTVKLELLGVDMLPASAPVVASVLNNYHPSDVQESGLAPIGHTVTVVAATGVTINISADVTFDEAYTETETKRNIKSNLEKYMANLRESWEDEYNANKRGISIRIAAIESVIFNTPGVTDVSDGKINGVGENITLDIHSVPVLGEVTYG